MSKLTDRISYLQGLAEGMKLNPEKDSNRLILEILDVLGEVGDSFEALAESHGELSDYVESIDEDLADLEADLYDDENEDLAEEEDGDFEEGYIEYECPHCGATVEIAGARGLPFARGLVNFDADECRKLLGCRSGRLHEILGADADEELVHRDNMLLLE